MSILVNTFEYDKIKTMYILLKDDLIKNEAFRDTSHHQVIYAMLKLKSWIRVKIFICY